MLAGQSSVLTREVEGQSASIDEAALEDVSVCTVLRYCVLLLGSSSSSSSSSL